MHDHDDLLPRARLTLENYLNDLRYLSEISHRLDRQQLSALLDVAVSLEAGGSVAIRPTLITPKAGVR